MWSDESETVESGAVAAAPSCTFDVDSRGSLNRPLEGLFMRGQRNFNRLASTINQYTAMASF